MPNSGTDRWTVCERLYHFRTMSEQDLPLVARWLKTPDVARWWGDPLEQLTLVTNDLGDPQMRQWIVSLEEFPFAYVQAYPAHAWPQSHLMHMPFGAEAIDVCIGEPALLNGGHGSALLRQFAQMLLQEGATAVVIDPEPDNLRARKAYEHAGFSGTQIAETADGPAVIMVFKP
jgi:aminoglycoside 6'-N-acetyltransferase